MDVALQRAFAGLGRVHGVAGCGAEEGDVGGGDEGGGVVRCLEEAVFFFFFFFFFGGCGFFGFRGWGAGGAGGMGQFDAAADGDVAEGVEDFVVGEDAVCVDEVGDEGGGDVVVCCEAGIHLFLELSCGCGG